MRFGRLGQNRTGGVFRHHLAKFRSSLCPAAASHKNVSVFEIPHPFWLAQLLPSWIASITCSEQLCFQIVLTRGRRAKRRPVVEDVPAPRHVRRGSRQSHPSTRAPTPNTDDKWRTSRRGRSFKWRKTARPSCPRRAQRPPWPSVRLVPLSKMIWGPASNPRRCSKNDLSLSPSESKSLAAAGYQAALSRRRSKSHKG